MKKSEIKKLIKEHGSAYRAAKALKISPQAFYERMSRAGVDRSGYKKLSGEPDTKAAKKRWLKALLEEYGTVRAVANVLGRSPSAIHDRMGRLGVRVVKPNIPGEPVDREKKKEWLERKLRDYGNGKKVAEAFNVTPQAIYERMSRYGIK